VSYYGGNLLMEKVQDPIMNAARCGAKLVDSVAQEIRLRPTQLVAPFAKPFDPDENLVSRMHGQLGKPIDKRCRTILLALNHDPRFRHL